MKTAIFFERDGVLNMAGANRHHPITPATLADFQVIPEAAPLLYKLKAAGFLLIVTTNQPGLSGGDLSRRELDRMHDVLRRDLPLDDILVCPHDESDDCPCHKPGSGMFLEASFKWHIDLERSFVISDKWQDATAARLVGCTSVLIQSPWIGAAHRDFLVPGLSAAVDKIFQLQVPAAAKRLAA